MAPTTKNVWPVLGTTYPDANGIPITSDGATVAWSQYIDDALHQGYLLDWDPLEVFQPQDRTDMTGDAPANATFVVMSANALLSNERVLTAGTGISITDGGANGTVTIAATTGDSLVSSVFGRLGAVVALAGDYTSSLITNLSTAAGGTVTAALDTLAASVADLLSRTLSAGAGLTGGGTLAADRTFAVGANADGSITVNTDDIQVGVLATDAQHGVRGGGTQHATATTSVAGFMSATDKAAHDALASASLVTVSAVAGLANERVLTAGTGISISDGGAGGALTITNTITSTAPNNAPYVTIGTSGSLSAERALTAGTGVTITDGGANSTVTIATPNAVQGPASSVDNAVARFDTTTGKLIQNSAVTIDDSGNIATVGTVDGVDVSALAAVPYVTIGTSATTSAERALTAGTGITVTDGGAGGNVTVAAPGLAAQFLTLAATGDLANERVLNPSLGLKVTDGGPGGAYTIDAELTVSTFSSSETLTVGGGLRVFTGASTVNLTVPTNASVAYRVGARVEIFNDASLSTSDVNIVAAGGVTLVPLLGLLNPTVVDYNDRRILTKIGTDRWLITQ